MRKKLLVIISLFLIVLLPSVAAFSSNSTSTSEWRMFGRTLDNNRYYPSSINMSHFGLLWSSEIGELVIASSPSLAEGILYIPVDYSLYALNATNGSILWNHTTQDLIYSSPAISGNIVYIGSIDDQIYALNATNGSLIWNYTTGDDIYSSPAVDNGVLYIGSYDDQIYALNATNGSLIWNYTTNGDIASSPSLSDGLVYITSIYTLYAFNATNGSMIWNSSLSSDTLSSPVIYNGTLYIGSDDFNIYAFNATNGSLIWNYTTGWGIISTPVLANGMVYTASFDQKVYALNITNGNLIWNYSTPSFIYSSPVVANDTVFVGNYDSYIYAFNALNGSMLWNYSTTNIIVSSPSIVDEKLYVASYDHTLYAFSALPNKPPSITISAPANDYLTNLFNITFNFTVTDDFDTSLFCNLSIDGEVNQSNISFTNGTSKVIYAAANFSEITHFWNLTCWDNDKSTNTSITRNLTIDITPPKTAPNITQVNDTDFDGNIEVNWTADPNAEKYGIFRSGANFSDCSSAVRLANISGTFFQDNTTTHNTQYWYAVTSIDYVGNENISIINTTTMHAVNGTSNDTIVPRLPTSINVTDSDNTATISWPSVLYDIQGNPDFHNLTYEIWYLTTDTVNGSQNISAQSFQYLTSNTNYTTFSIPSTCTDACNYLFIVTTLDDGGNRNISLNVSDYVKVNVTLTYTEPETSGSTSTSGGGGGGGAARSSFNTETAVRDEFSRGWATLEGYQNISVNTGLIPITSVSFTLKEPANSVIFTIELLLSHPPSIPRLENDAYAFMKITAKNLPNSNLLYPKIHFKVKNSWLQSKNLDKGEISLFRYDSRQWHKLITALERSDSDYSYYVSVIPGFSYFAVASFQETAGKATNSLSMNNETSQNATASQTPNASLSPQPAQVSGFWGKIGLIIGIFLAIISGAVVGYLIISFNQGRKVKSFESREKQSDLPKELIDYIQSQIDLKILPEKIREALISRGWQKDTVENAFKFISHKN